MRRFALRRNPEFGRPLRSFRLPGGRLRCPHCGRVHLRALWSAWPVILLPAVLAFQSVALAGAPAAVPQRNPADRGKDAAQILVTPEPLPPAVNLTAAVPTTVPPAAPAPVAPASAVVWDRVGGGIYLWADPAGGILAFIENGSVVELQDEWAAYGGIPFGKARFGETEGWVDMRHVHRLEIPPGGFERVGEAGAFLYAEPGGERLEWLSPGSPVVVLEARADGWAAVRLLIGGKIGWINDAADLKP